MALAQAAPDGDKDGVPDSLDDCPYTPIGAKVDRSGCALDEDFDGVADGLDRCPNTPLGAVVDGDGCAKDQIVGGAPAAPAAAPPSPPPAIVNAPAPPPAAAPGPDPFSTRAPTPIQAYPIGEAPTPGQVNSGTVAVPPPAPYPTVPDQVREELDARASGKTIVNMPVLRNPSETPAASLPPETAAVPVAPAPAEMPAAAPVAEVPPPMAPAPAVKYVEAPVYYQRPIKTQGPPLSTAPVTPIAPKPVITSQPSFNAPLPFSGGAPVDPFGTLPAPSAAKAEWSVALGAGGEISGSTEQELRVAADAIKQAQRENPSLNYEVAGAESAAGAARAFLLAQGVSSSRLRLKPGAGDKVVIRPASD